jgi:hypothetical protein
MARAPTLRRSGALRVAWQVALIDNTPAETGLAINATAAASVELQRSNQFHPCSPLVADTLTMSSNNPTPKREDKGEEWSGPAANKFDKYATMRPS